MSINQQASAGEDAEKREPSCTAGGNADWCSHCGKRYGVTPKNSKWNCLILPFESSRERNRERGWPAGSGSPWSCKASPGSAERSSPREKAGALLFLKSGLGFTLPTHKKKKHFLINSKIGASSSPSSYDSLKLPQPLLPEGRRNPSSGIF